MLSLALSSSKLLHQCQLRKFRLVVERTGLSFIMQGLTWTEAPWLRFSRDVASSEACFAMGSGPHHPHSRFPPVSACSASQAQSSSLQGHPL